MTPQEFLLWEQTSRDTIDFKRIYVDIAGDIVSGLLLSQIIYWNLPDEKGKTKLRVIYQGELWIAKGREDWWEECRISPKQFDRSIKILETKGLVRTALKKFDGSPMKHIYLNLVRLLEEMQIVLIKESEGKMDFDQRGKSKLPKGKNPISPNSKKDIDQTVNSLTESTTKNTTKTTPKKSSGRFNDFEQRDTDYDALERKLLGWDKNNNVEG